MGSGKVEHLLQRVDTKVEEQWREGIPFLNSVDMGDGRARHRIKKNTISRLDKESGNPITKSTRKTLPLEEINQLVPPYRVLPLEEDNFTYVVLMTS
jgi:hypothetical protein